MLSPPTRRGPQIATDTRATRAPDEIVHDAIQFRMPWYAVLRGPALRPGDMSPWLMQPRQLREHTSLLSKAHVVIVVMTRSRIASPCARRSSASLMPALSIVVSSARRRAALQPHVATAKSRAPIHQLLPALQLSSAPTRQCVFAPHSVRCCCWLLQACCSMLAAGFSAQPSSLRDTSVASIT